MNITDVDDKIILKARRTYLFDKYVTANKSFSDELKKYVEESWLKHLNSIEKKLMDLYQSKAKEKEKAAEEKLLREKLEESKKEAEKIFELLKKGKNLSPEELSQIFERSKEPLSILLDDQQGSTVTDPTIFRQTASIYEREFLEDMKELGVRPPDVLTRVTEYIPEIIGFVQKILDNKLAYASNGSVYFDTKEYLKTHTYGKLAPW